MENGIEKRLYHFMNFTTEYESCITDAANCTVMYIHGLNTTPWSRRADKLKETALKSGNNFFRCELLGHGSDKDNLINCDFDLWKQQLQDIIENHISGNIIIAGHCVGGWLGMCLAEKYPDRVKAFLSMATSPDLIEQKLRHATPEQRQNLAQTGCINTHIGKYHYIIPQRLWTSMHTNDLLQQPSININCPIHLIQGQQDNLIEWQVVLRLLNKITSPYVVVKLLKHSNHHLQDAVALREITQSLTDLLIEIQK